MAAAPPLPPSSILPGDSLKIHLLPAAAPCAPAESVSGFFLLFFFFNIISLSPVLVHNHISFSIDRLFLSHILPLLYLRRVRLFNPMIWMQGSVSHAASLRIRARSLALWLLFICHKRQHTHRRTHSTQLWCTFPSSLLLSRLSHTRAHTLSLFLFLP